MDGGRLSPSMLARLHELHISALGQQQQQQQQQQQHLQAHTSASSQYQQQQEQQQQQQQEQQQRYQKPLFPSVITTDSRTRFGGGSLQTQNLFHTAQHQQDCTSSPTMDLRLLHLSLSSDAAASTEANRMCQSTVVWDDTGLRATADDDGNDSDSYAAELAWMIEQHVTLKAPSQNMYIF